MDDQSSSDSNHLPNPPKMRKTGGRRCIAGGCNNTAYDGFFTHRLPGKIPCEGERFSPIQKAWIDFINRRRKFDSKDAKLYKSIALCSGHFREEDYETSHVQMYRYGKRTIAPYLKKDAVPTVDIAKQPFPREWFVQTSDHPSLESKFTTAHPSSAHPVPVVVPPTMSTPTSPQPQEEEIFEQSSLPSLTGSSDRGYRKLKRSRKSMHIRKKEVDAICVEYAKKAEEERCQEKAKDILERSKSEQYSVRMVDHRVGTKKGRRSCKVQVTPKIVSKGVQANIFTKPVKVNAVVIYADAATQTTESRLVPEQEVPGQEDGDDIDDELKDPSYNPLSSSDEEVRDV